MPTKLQILREERGYSQRELAKVSGIAQATISLIEAEGRRAHPKTMKRIADALGVTIHDITEFAAPPKPRHSPKELAALTM